MPLLLRAGATGHVRTMTLKAFARDQLEEFLKKMP
jgi:uncharacterized protein with GYD domain